MKKRTPVTKIMSDSLHTVNHTNSLEDVQKLIATHGIHHVPVVSGTKLIGMISKTDLERITFVNDYSGGDVGTQLYTGLSIEQVMTKDLVSVKTSDTIFDVAVILSENAFHALPVMEGEELKGIVTTTDLIKFLIDNF